MRIRLQVVAPGGQAYPYDHEGGRLTVGRDPDCGLAFTDDLGQAVSWRHLQIELTAQDARLQDLGSTNGTFLNGERIQGVTLLREGDRVQLGRTGPKLRVAELDLTPGRVPQFAPAPAMLVEPEEPAPLRAVPASFAASAVPPPPSVPHSPPVPPDQGGTHVRMRSMRRTLGELASNQRKMIYGLGILALLMIGSLGVVVWLQYQEITEHKGEIKKLQARLDTKEAPRDQEIQARVLRALGWVHWSDGKTSTGAVVDKGRKLLLTVCPARSGDSVSVLFPEFSSPVEVVRDRAHYQEAARITGKVVHRDPDSHLTLIQLASLPAECNELPLAQRSAPPQARVHALGNSAASTTLWEWAASNIRQVAPKHLDAEQGEEALDAWCLETLSPLHGGDRGGPVVDDRGELVAVHSGRGNPAQGSTFCIDIRTIRGVLLQHEPAGPPTAGTQ